MYVVTVDMPSLADGAEIHIDGLGSVTKGQPNYISDEDAAAYEANNIGHEPAYDEEGALVGMSQTHPTLDELLNKFQGVHAHKLDSFEETSLELSESKPSEGDQDVTNGDPTEPGNEPEDVKELTL